MNELRVIKTAISASRIFSFFSAIASATALLTAICVTVSVFKKVKM